MRAAVRLGLVLAMKAGMDNQHRAAQSEKADDAAERAGKRKGDILGISDVDPSVPLPGAPASRGGSSGQHEPDPDPRRHTTVHRSPGATGIDMGAGGTGTDVEPASTRRPKPTE
jgi:hypothetical protein